MNDQLRWVAGTSEAEGFKRDLKGLKAWELKDLRRNLDERRRSEGSEPGERDMRWELGMKLEFIADEMYRRGYE
jgi:hypothetical protein